MISLLLDSQNWFTSLRATFGDTLLIIFALVIFFVFLYLLQYKGVQIFALVALSLAIFAGGIFSTIKINKYYSASGGIAGKLESLLKPNKVTGTSDEIGFKFENLMMTLDEDENYSVYVISEEIMELEENEEYVVFINDCPCRLTYKSTNYVEFEYSYVFRDKKHEPILDDTLYIQIVFHKNRTELNVYTTGGIEAKNLWQSYFEKNNFELNLEKVVTETTDNLKVLAVS